MSLNSASRMRRISFQRSLVVEYNCWLIRYRYSWPPTCDSGVVEIALKVARYHFSLAILEASNLASIVANSSDQRGSIVGLSTSDMLIVQAQLCLPRIFENEQVFET